MHVQSEKFFLSGSVGEKFPGQMGSLEFFTALPDKKPDSQRKSKYRGPQLYWYDFQKRINFPFLHYRMVAGSEFSFVVLIGDSGFVFTAPRMRQDPNVVKLEDHMEQNGGLLLAPVEILQLKF